LNPDEDMEKAASKNSRRMEKQVKEKE